MSHTEPEQSASQLSFETTVEYLLSIGASAQELVRALPLLSSETPLNIMGWRKLHDPVLALILEFPEHPIIQAIYDKIIERGIKDLSVQIKQSPPDFSQPWDLTPEGRWLNRLYLGLRFHVEHRSESLLVERFAIEALGPFGNHYLDNGKYVPDMFQGIATLLFTNNRSRKRTICWETS